MPRRLLRDGRIVLDEWTYSAETANNQLDATAAQGLILTFDQWFAGEPGWSSGAGRLGVVLLPVHKVEQLTADLSRFDLICVDFPGPSEGRGYTQGRLLRERYGFDHELRATGYVRRDQLFFLARCGFNSFELPEQELAHAHAALSTFSAEYQPSNDRGLDFEPEHR